MTSTPFTDLGLPPKVVAALFIEDITEPTPVQAAVLPDALAGYDVLGRAQTGSGKTLAFGLPVIVRLAGAKSRINRPRAIIMVPTRELAGQVQRALEPIARAEKLRLVTVYGGSPYDRQLKALRQGVDIVVATPGRLGDLIERGDLRTDDVQITVLDEADHLCDLGFFLVVDELLSKTPADAQRLLLSATLDGDVDKLVTKHLRDPKLHELDPSAGAVTTMEHHVMVVGGYGDKIDAVAKLVDANPRTIVFVRTRESATQLRDALAERDITAVDLHGNLTQRVRERNLHKFKKGDAQTVVATDVAARGIHVDGIGLVVHFDSPTDPKAYLHRSGRTARAGESGAVVTLTVRKRLDEVRRLQKSAGVQAKHHDIRTAPQPMTVEALGQAPAVPAGKAANDAAPDRSRAPRSSSGFVRNGADRNRADRNDAGQSRTGRTQSDRAARTGRSSTDRPRDERVRAERPRRERASRSERPSAELVEAGGRPKKSTRRSTGKPGSATHKVGKKARWTGAQKRAAKR
ncbi:MAG: DEAD/DEAH box helicase [Nocardioidaceae bacterium]|nr:MAG: DEAD/DEAH box helicase [Nocardioidaceae bacterium]